MYCLANSLVLRDELPRIRFQQASLLTLWKTEPPLRVLLANPLDSIHSAISLRTSCLQLETTYLQQYNTGANTHKFIE